MKISLDFRHPTPAHCDIAIFVDGGLAGTITLRQDEIVEFNEVVASGCKKVGVGFLRTGNSVWSPTDEEDGET